MKTNKKREKKSNGDYWIYAMLSNTMSYPLPPLCVTSFMNDPYHGGSLNEIIRHWPFRERLADAVFMPLTTLFHPPYLLISYV